MVALRMDLDAVSKDLQGEALRKCTPKMLHKLAVEVETKLWGDPKTRAVSGAAIEEPVVEFRIHSELYDGSAFGEPVVLAVNADPQLSGFIGAAKSRFRNSC